MKLPKDHNSLPEMFRNARAPHPAEFEGEYYVDMLTVVPSFRRFAHRKVFYRYNDRVEGHNILLGRTWGRFFLEQNLCEDTGPAGAVIINYDSEKNSSLTRRIRDYVRCIEEEISYLGRFYYFFWGRLRFSGYFSLVKK